MWWPLLLAVIVCIGACSKANEISAPSFDTEITSLRFKPTARFAWTVGEVYDMNEVYIGLNAENEVVEPLHDMSYSFEDATMMPRFCSEHTTPGSKVVLDAPYTGYICAWYKGKRWGNHFVDVSP